MSGKLLFTWGLATLVAITGCSSTSSTSAGVDGGADLRPDGVVEADRGPSCPSGQVLCGGKCVDPLADRAFCGASSDCAGANAGESCSAGQVCSTGSCALSCQSGLIDCGGKCIDPLVDNAFCGASSDCAGANAGVTCSAGQVCSTGSCALSCQSGLIDCGGKCIDPLVDNAFCGATAGCGAGGAGSAGTSCAAGTVCSAGSCALSCQSGLIDCGGKCIDPLVDNAFCGATAGCGAGGAGSAGTSCAAGTTCSAGTCTLSCQAGLSKCGPSGSEECVNLLTDNRYCSSSATCGSACPAGTTCTNGVCAPTCGPGLTSCGGGCVDTGTSRNHCGGCGNSCLAGQFCAAGTCTVICPPNYFNCNNSCVDPMTDRNNCGVCGRRCSPAYHCAGGACRITLPWQCTGYTAINDVTRNVNHTTFVGCDRGVMSNRWYRFEGAGGTQMPTTAPPTYRCGTHAPGWLNGSHPAASAQTVTRTVCFHWLGNTCNWSAAVQVTNCNGYYVYQLPSPAHCSVRYCTE